jgi:excisionase family DNA binding protein
MLRRMAKHVTLGEAARMIGVSADTLRRWDRSGKVRTTRDERNRRLVSLAEVRRLGGPPHATALVTSCRRETACPASCDP